MNYYITTFVADKSPTEYRKPLEGGAPFAVGSETIAEYDNYDDCYTQLEAYSANTALGCKTWTSHKMYREAKQPQLLHYIDNNYPGISLPSKAGDKI